MSRPPGSMFLRALILCMPLCGCRVPEPPVLEDKNAGIIYDSAMETELRNGTAASWIQTTYGDYVDTLAEPVAITDWTEKSCRWEVFIATNRGVWDNEHGLPDPNRALLHPHFGRADVQLPRGRTSRKTGWNTLGVPLRKPTDDDPSSPKMNAAKLSQDDFLRGVSDQVQRSRQHDLLLFVHGFNVDFDSAVIGIAQLGLKMPFNGALVTYCWPTQGGVRNYQSDEPINRASVAPFTEFLETLRTGVPEDTQITILVHSMGNRIVMKALSQLPPAERKPIAQVVLCAPDVGRADFEAWAPGVLRQSEHVAVYSNASDTALIASKGLHAESRAGDAWEPVLIPGIETIDCSRIDLSFMGHSYYGENRDVLTDLFMLVKERRPASRRPHLERRTNDDGTEYWSFHTSAGKILCNWHFNEDIEPVK